MKKIVLTFILSFILVLSTGCELVKKVPGNNDNGDTQTSTENQEPELNASDHIFDIDLERIRTDLTGKTLGVDKDWKIQPEDIIDSEFGGSSLANGRMESRYYLKMKKPGTETLLESAVTFSYDWDRNKWIFINADQAYIEPLEEDAQSLDREVRKEKMEAYRNRPAAVPTETPDAEALADKKAMEEDAAKDAALEKEALNEDIGGVTEEEALNEAVEEGITEEPAEEEITEEPMPEETVVETEEGTTEEVTQ